MTISEIIIGSDHAGFDLKEHLKNRLAEKGIGIKDVGPYSGDRVDYPDFAHTLATDIEQGNHALGVLICGSGNGINMTANKHAGIRSALCWTPEIASLARQHNDANVLALPARFISNEEADAILDAFLEAEFEGGRHEGRVEKISKRELL